MSPENALIFPNDPQNISLTTADSPEPNAAFLYLAGLSSEASRATMLKALKRVCRVMGVEVGPLALDWRQITPSMVAVIRTQLAEQYARTTANHTLAAIRGVMRAAWLDGQISGEHYQKVSAIKSLSGSNLAAGRDISRGEMVELYTHLNQLKSPLRERNKAIFAVLQHGLRASEVVELRLSDFKVDRLVFTGKGRKEREVFLQSKAIDLIQGWLVVRGDGSDGPLFCGVDKDKVTITGQPLQYHALYQLVRRYAEKLGFDPTTPHDFRRTFVGDLLNAGVDISTIAKQAGHAQVTTTQRYDRRDVEMQQKAMKHIHIPD